MSMEHRRGMRNALEGIGRRLGAQTGLATARGRTYAAAPAGVWGLGKRMRHGRG